MPLLQIISKAAQTVTVENTLTLMLRIGDHFADHRLDNSHVAIEGSTQCSADKSHPEIGRKPDRQERDNGSQTAEKNNGLPSYPI